MTDGFTGNVALKTGEGALQLFGDLLRQVFRSSLTAKVAYLLLRPSLERLREWLDPRRYNGAVMLGLNGVVVKSHGGTDAEGFAHAMDVAMDMVVHRFNDHIREDLTRIAELMALAAKNGALRKSPEAARALPPRRRETMAIRSILAGVGGYLPDRAVSNDELARTWRHPTNGSASVPASVSAISRHRTKRRLHGHGRGTSRARGCRRRPDEVDAIILATSTPDQAFPATALRVQAALGVTNGFGFDIAAACAGFIYALSVADGMLRTGQARGALVIGSEVYSRIINWQDRGTCVCSVTVRGRVPARGRGSGRTDRGILSTHLHAQGTLGDILYVDGAVGPARQAQPPGNERSRGLPPRRRPRSPKRSKRPSPRMDWSGVTSTGWCRTRPICGSSTQWAASSGCRRAGGDHRRSARQHIGRLGPAGTGRSAQGWTHPQRRPRADGGAGRRIAWGSALVRM